MNDGKVGVGFCPQNAFGSAVGFIPRLVEGVACSLREQALASAVIAWWIIGERDSSDSRIHCLLLLSQPYRRNA